MTSRWRWSTLLLLAFTLGAQAKEPVVIGEAPARLSQSRCDARRLRHDRLATASNP